MKRVLNDLFLDYDKTMLLTVYLLKKQYLKMYFDESPIEYEFDKDRYSKLSSAGIKNLLILLTLYEKVGFIRTSYKYDEFYNMGFSKLNEKVFFDEQAIKDTLLLMRMNYKRLKYNFEKKYRYKVDMPSFKELLLKRFVPYMEEFWYINEHVNFVKLFKILLAEGGKFDETLLLYFYQTMLSLMYGIASKADFYTSIFDNNNDLSLKSDQKDIIDDIYYICKLELPNELNILPAPQTLEDVINYRKSPYIKSFRNIFQEWMSYVEEGNINLAKKVEKDVIRANGYFEKLEKYHKFTSSPFVRTCLFAGGFIPIASEIINISTYAGGIIEDGLARKNNWVLITNNEK